MPPRSTDHSEKDAAGGADQRTRADATAAGPKARTNLHAMRQSLFPTIDDTQTDLRGVRRQMKPRAKSCTQCGRRTPDGTSRCELHKSAGRRLRPCLVCGAPSAGNYCQTHDPKIDEAERLLRNPYRKAYKDAEYARNRQIRFERARGRCEACGTPLLPAEWECDHVITIRQGGNNKLENLRVLCKPCHRSKTRRERRAD